MNWIMLAKDKHKNMKKILKILAATIWYIGAVILFFKGLSLLFKIPNQDLIIIGVILAILFGAIKTKFIFIKACKKNIRRIDNLNNPKIWQFYTPKFFLFLAAMIMLGAYLSYIADYHIYLLVLVGSIDLALSAALFFSGIYFWKDR